MDTEIRREYCVVRFERSCQRRSVRIADKRDPCKDEVPPPKKVFWIVVVSAPWIQSSNSSRRGAESFGGLEGVA